LCLANASNSLTILAQLFEDGEYRLITRRPTAGEEFERTLKEVYRQGSVKCSRDIFLLPKSSFFVYEMTNLSDGSEMLLVSANTFFSLSFPLFSLLLSFW
jgi:hypothetical protein